MNNCFKYLAALALISLICAPAPALAHKVRIFATAEGPVISGYAYFPGGSRVKNMVVKALDGAGKLLAQTKTNDQGEFSLTAKKGVDHHLVIDLGDGHLAKFTVRAEELPEDLPRPGGAAQAKAAVAPAQTKATAPVQGLDQTKLKDMIEAATAKAVRPLREDLEAIRQKIGLQDVIGGIGYIFGLMGLFMWYAARRKTQGGGKG